MIDAFFGQLTYNEAALTMLALHPQVTDLDIDPWTSPEDEDALGPELVQRMQGAADVFRTPRDTSRKGFIAVTNWAFISVVSPRPL